MSSISDTPIYYCCKHAHKWNTFADDSFSVAKDAGHNFLQQMIDEKFPNGTTHESVYKLVLFLRKSWVSCYAQMAITRKQLSEAERPYVKAFEEMQKEHAEKIANLQKLNLDLLREAKKSKDDTEKLKTSLIEANNRFSQTLERSSLEKASLESRIKEVIGKMRKEHAKEIIDRDAKIVRLEKNLSKKIAEQSKQDERLRTVQMALDNYQLTIAEAQREKKSLTQQLLKKTKILKEAKGELIEKINLIQRQVEEMQILKQEKDEARAKEKEAYNLLGIVDFVLDSP